MDTTDYTKELDLQSKGLSIYIVKWCMENLSDLQNMWSYIKKYCELRYLPMFDKAEFSDFVSLVAQMSSIGHKARIPKVHIPS